MKRKLGTRWNASLPGLRLCLGLALGLLATGWQLEAAGGRITTPREFLGFNLGDDYRLANYRQLTNYWAKLDRESSRLKVVNIGPTAEGRPQLMGIVTSPSNHRWLARYQSISRRLAGGRCQRPRPASSPPREGRGVD